MSSTKDGTMIILSSPSGAGKTTLVKLLAETNNYQISISHTTRKPRQNETYGKDYFFTNEKDFKDLISKGEFLEHAKVFNNFYGTTLKPVKDNLDKGQNVIFDIDWQGAQQIKNKGLKYKLITFFLLPPSKEVLFNRLSNRDMKDKVIVEERMKEFNKDILHWRNYDYVVINDELENCFKEICNLIESKTNKTKNNYNLKSIEDHVNKLIS
jgi:guanylate kinase